MVDGVRFWVPWLFLWLLGGCFQSTQSVVPESLLQQLEGRWQQEGHEENQLTFYRDETVKVIMPSHRPPLRLLTHIEALRDDVVLNFGDRWERPASVRYDQARDQVVLGFVSEDGKTVSEVRFLRVRER